MSVTMKLMFFSTGEELFEEEEVTFTDYQEAAWYLNFLKRRNVKTVLEDIYGSDPGGNFSVIVEDGEVKASPVFNTRIDMVNAFLSAEFEPPTFECCEHCIEIHDKPHTIPCNEIKFGTVDEQCQSWESVI